MLAAVGVMEVVMYAKTIVASTGSITPYIVAALFYLVITLPLAKVVGKLEKKLANNDTGSGPSSMSRKERRAAKKAAKHESLVDRRIDLPDANASAEAVEVSPERFSSM
jgi:hypothetical protein